MNNLLTDIDGVSVGHADDAALASGVTAILFDRPAVASVDVRGGGPGTREDALLDPVSTVEAIDAITLSGLSIPQRPIIKGDGLSCSIAAASIVAKVTRDRLMVEYHRWYPRYNFAEHKGYGTPEHLHVLRALGPCPIHRRSFAPVRAYPAGDGNAVLRPLAQL